MAWTKFMDMYSGGMPKVPPYEYIFIEAKKIVAAGYFVRRFNQNPHGEFCECCGDNYSISEGETLEDLTEGETLEDLTKLEQRMFALEKFLTGDNVLVIQSEEIENENC